MRRITQKEVEEYFLKNGGWQVISQYAGNHDSIDIEKDGYKSRTNLADFKTNGNVLLFGSKNPYFKENIKLLLFKKNKKVQFVDAQVIKKSGKSRLVVSMIDENGHPFKKLIEHIHSDIYLCCPVCAKKTTLNKRRSTRKDAWIKAIEENGFKLLENPKRFAADIKVDVVQLSTGYKFHIGLNNIKRSANPEPFSPVWNGKFLIDNLAVFAKINDLMSEPVRFIESRSSHNKVRFKCLCGEEFERSINKWMSGQDLCNICSGKNSSYERMVSQFLDNEKIDYISEFIISTCRDKNPLPFDFYLKDYKCFIEIDGQQHYQSIDYGFGQQMADRRLRIQQMHDRIKNEYCLKYKIPLLRIPYWDFATNSWRTAIQEFIRPLEINDL